MTSKVILSKLQTKNFRNIAFDTISFDPKINCIFGHNGNGKTNILEIIYFLANRKSFRKNTSFPQILSFDGDNSEIFFSCLLEKGSEQISYSGKWNQENSMWAINNQQTKDKLPLNCVFINPSDSFSFFNDAKFRRDFFNYHFSLIDDPYKKEVLRLKKLLKLRNKLLVTPSPTQNQQIYSLDKLFVEAQMNILSKRTDYFAKISQIIKPIYKKIFNISYELEFKIDSNFNPKFGPLEHLSQLKSQLELDKLKGRTSLGIHRDNIIPVLNGFNALEFASLGQQKMAYLALLFAYIELFRYKFETTPLVLMDDISGELDHVRWSNLIRFLDKCDYQVLITTANEAFKSELCGEVNAKSFNIQNGKFLQ